MSSSTRAAAAANRRAPGGTGRDGRNGRYDGVAILLRWALALLIPALVGLGWYMLSIEKDPGSAWFLALHISLGLTAAFLIALRVVWRRSHRPPLLPWATPAWEATAARLSHAVLYGLMVLMPITAFSARLSAAMRSAFSASRSPAGPARTTRSRTSSSRPTRSSPGCWSPWWLCTWRAR